MTEAEWMRGPDTSRMLKSLGDRASERKFRLFGVACCRRVWRLLADERSRQAVEVAERYAEGAATMVALLAAWEAAVLAEGTRWEEDYSPNEDVPANAAAWCAYISNRGHSSAGFAADGVCRYLRKRDALFHADCIRCILGNPFRPVSLSSAVLAWNDSTVVRLAQTAYEERQLPDGTLDNGRLAILADALEEAGYSDADILGHLRGPGTYVRGCWPVDLCLGKS